MRYGSVMYGDRTFARQPARRMRSTSRRGSTAATAARGDCGSRGLAATAPIGEPGRGVLSESAFGGSCSVATRCRALLVVAHVYRYRGRPLAGDLLLPRESCQQVPSPP